MDIKSAIRAVGDQSRYQVFSIAFVSFKWLAMSLMVLGPSYMMMTPTFTCGNELKVGEDDACKRISECTINNPNTITAQTNLYCDNRFVRDTLLSSEYVGSIVGLVVLSIMADKLGRKLIINLCLLASTSGSILLAVGANWSLYWMIGIGVVLMGLGGYSLTTVSFIYLGEVCSDRWRQASIILTSAFWAVAQMLLYPIITYLPEWKEMIVVSLITPLVLLFIMSYWVTQTPQYLYNNSSKQKCLESLNYIAKFNKMSPLKLNDLKDKELANIEKFKIQDTLLKWKFLLPLLILAFGQICNNGMYYITQYSFNQIGSTFQMNMLIIGILQFLGYFSMSFFCQKMKRKLWIMIFMCVSGVIGVLFQFFFKSDSQDWDTSRYIETICIGISRLANTFCFCFFPLITTESFPQSIKTTGTGLVEAVSNLGDMSAPFIVTLAEKMHVQAMLVGGIICFLAAISLIPIKQTLVKPGSKQRTVEDDPLLKESIITENSTSEPLNTVL